MGEGKRERGMKGGGRHGPDPSTESARKQQEGRRHDPHSSTEVRERKVGRTSMGTPTTWGGANSLTDSGTETIMTSGTGPASKATLSPARASTALRAPSTTQGQYGLNDTTESAGLASTSRDLSHTRPGPRKVVPGGHTDPEGRNTTQEDLPRPTTTMNVGRGNLKA
ncbi:hypothetical protein MHU86_16881 [Fragilaria crotonensis]|nr:hypothetical protein MHU86_16881 [Fragilaria crotonensis]